MKINAVPGRLATCMALGVALSGVPNAHAQTVPDAGQILREQPAPAPPPSGRPAVADPAPAASSAADDGPRIRVQAVRVAGATLVPAATLEAQLAHLVGRELSFGQLQQAALLLTAAYAERGYLARVFLPPQEVVGGQVSFQVVEGRRGRLRVEQQGQRIDAARVQAFVDHRLPAGAPMDLAALGEAMAVLNEQPGADVNAALASGDAEADVDLALRLRDTQRVTSALTVHNHASRGVGTLQAVGSVTLNNPTGRFDAASLLASASEGSAYLRADYGMALGVAGTRIKAHAAALSYRLVQESFRPLRAHGTAMAWGLSASHPLARRQALSATLSGGAEFKRLVDQANGGESGNRQIQVAHAGLSGTAVLGADARPGELVFGIVANAGHVDQRNTAARAADAIERSTQGGFATLGLNLGWRQSLAADWTIGLNGSGQWADGNLDSSEQFVLGGAGGVRAYPSGEGTGDQGWLLSASIGRQIGQQLLVSAFVDGGEVTLNHTPLPMTARNRHGLAGAGLSADWQFAARSALRVVLAAPLGHNPAAATSGNDADGRRSGGVRLWASVTAQF